MILKLLLVLGVIGIVYFMFIKKSPPKSVKKESPKRAKQESEEMIACVECGTYISANDAFLKAGQYYCSQECMDH